MKILVLLFASLGSSAFADPRVEIVKCNNTDMNPIVHITVFEKSVRQGRAAQLFAEVVENSDVKNALLFQVKLDPYGETFLSKNSRGLVVFKMKKTTSYGRFVDFTYKNKDGKFVSNGYTTYCDREW